MVVVDGMQGGTAATQDVFIEHAGIPTLPGRAHGGRSARATSAARGKVQLIVSGGIRSGADVAKALALGADAVSIGVAALLALGCNRDRYRDARGTTVDVTADYAALGTAPGRCAHCHTGRCPVGITTQDPVLESPAAIRSVPPTRWPTTCGPSRWKSPPWPGPAASPSVHHLEPEDLVALTVEAAAMARVPLAGTSWIPGWPS